MSGILDFSDLMLGDPAFDFAGLWMLGAWAPRAALASYGLPPDDPDFLKRSHLLFIRQLISLLWGACMSGSKKETASLQNIILRTIALH